MVRLALPACVIQFLCGLLILTFGLLAVFTTLKEFRESQGCISGIWNGILTILCAVIGLFQLRSEGQLCCVVYLTLCLITFVFTCLMVALSSCTVVYDVQSQYKTLDHSKLHPKEILDISANIGLVIVGSISGLATLTSLLSVAKALQYKHQERNTNTNNLSPLDLNSPNIKVYKAGSQSVVVHRDINTIYRM